MIFGACGLKEEDLLMDKEQKTLGEFWWMIGVKQEG
jgi:hypothetical protein